MPKWLNKSRKNLLPFIVATYGDHSVTIRRNRDYAQTIQSIIAVFQELESSSVDHLWISSKFPGFDQDIRITKDLWPELMSDVTGVTVIVAPCDKSGTPPRHRRFPRVSALLPEGRQAPGAQNGSAKPGSYSLSDSEPLGFMYGAAMVAKKPVIYLFPPVPTAGVHVDLSIVNTWKFSTLYPPTQITPISTARDSNGGQSVAWVVDAKPDGSLFDHNTRREVSYLFWEAHPNTTFPPSPTVSRPNSPVQGVLTFDPAHALVEPSNSALLPLDKITGYVDDVLQSLGLNTEARCSFITYWLPDWQCHKHIALRFLPQAEYETAAPLNVTPRPDVVTRVFMLFKGVAEARLDEWTKAQSKGNEDPSLWRDVVGVDLSKSQDASLFRVVEWGGMEVKSTM